MDSAKDSPVRWSQSPGTNAVIKSANGATKVSFNAINSNPPRKFIILAGPTNAVDVTLYIGDLSNGVTITNAHFNNLQVGVEYDMVLWGFECSGAETDLTIMVIY